MDQHIETTVPSHSHEFRIEQLFGSRTRARLLAIFLENADRAFYVRELTRRIDAQLNSVRRELKNLVDIGIVFEVDGKILPTENTKEEEKKGEKKFYRVNPAFPLFDDLRSVMRKAAVFMHQSIVHALQKKGEVDLVLVTGRFLDVPDVPTDVFIVGNIEAEEVALAVREFEREIAREVNFTAMTREEFLYRQEVGDRFLATILGAKHVILWNKILSL